jgi:CheY-like chemotaxis protein
MALEFQPGIVFLDIGMPGMNGYEVARALRKIPETKGVLLVALTGWGAEEDRVSSQRAGFDEHLIKPAHPAAVDELLSKFSQSLVSACVQ